MDTKVYHIYWKRREDMYECEKERNKGAEDD